LPKKELEKEALEVKNKKKRGKLKKREILKAENTGKKRGS
jgi:hypothetical protein